MKKYLLLLLCAVNLLSSCNDESTEGGASTEPEVLAENIVLSENELYLEVDDTSVLSARIEPENTTVQRVIWSVQESTVSNCLTVNKDGVVTARNEGTAIIVASTIDGSNISDSCFVTVGDPSTEDSDTEKIYAIGDAYPNEEEPIGVVFSVENKGRNGKIVSLDSSKEELKWGDDTYKVKCSDEVDGLYNTSLVQKRDEDFSDYPAFKWVHVVKNGGSAIYETGAKNVWYIPAQKELRELFAGMCNLQWIDDGRNTITQSTISDWGTDISMPYYDKFVASVARFNQNLVELGGSEIDNNWHWSSSEVVDYFAWYVDLYCGYTYHFHKGDPAIVRPIMKF